MRALNKLTTLGVKHITKPGLHGDGGGLYLQVSQTGAKSWLFRFMLAGRSREMGLGSLGAFTLAEARERARLQRQFLADGIDPIEHRRAQQAQAALAKAQTVAFEECARQYIDANKAGWKNAKHADQWTATLRTWAYPIDWETSGRRHHHRPGAQGARAADRRQSRRPQVLESPDRDCEQGPRPHREGLGLGSRLESYGEGENPARWKGLLENLLPPRSQVSPVEHRKALPYADLPGFMSELRRRDSLSARALEYTILTAARTGDTIGAVRAEIDTGGRVWTVPGTRLKGRKGARRRRDHVVPLSDRALEIIDALPDHSESYSPTRTAPLCRTWPCWSCCRAWASART